MSELEQDLNVSQVEKILNCSSPMVWKLLNQGELTGYHVGRAMRITRESVLELKTRNKYIPRKKTA